MTVCLDSGKKLEARERECWCDRCNKITKHLVVYVGGKLINSQRIHHLQVICEACSISSDGVIRRVQDQFLSDCDCKALINGNYY